MVFLSIDKLKSEANPHRSVLSVDVGLTNLAICWLENTTDKVWKIHYWKVIDLNTQHSPDTHCSHICKNKKPCKRNAVMIMSEDRPVCKQHGPKTSKTDCKSISTSREVLQKTVHNAIKYLKAFLVENCKDLEAITECVIEKQPLKSTALQTMSHVLYTLFVEHFGTEVPIYMTPAYNKTIHISGLISPPKASKGRAGYKQRKQNGVMTAQKVIEHWDNLLHVTDMSSEGITKLKSNKGKLDDYADSFLQALFAITNNRLSTPK